MTQERAQLERAKSRARNYYHRYPFEIEYGSMEAHWQAHRIVDHLTTELTLPCQWASRFARPHVSPEIRLMLEVFYLALWDLRARGDKPVGHTARAWFEDVQSTGLFSLRTLCELFGLDPLTVSNAVLSQATEVSHAMVRRSPVIDKIAPTPGVRWRGENCYERAVKRNFSSHYRGIGGRS